MSDSFKRDLELLLMTVALSREYPRPDPCFVRGVPLDDAIAQARFRLAHATVTEPPIYVEDVRISLEGFLDEVRQHGSPLHSDEAHRLLRILKPEPTDAELREQLQTALPEWAVVRPRDDKTCYVSDGKVSSIYIGIPRYAALRKPGGPARVAQALKVLAGEEAE